MKVRNQQRQRAERMERIPPLNVAKVRAYAWARAGALPRAVGDGRTGIAPPPWGEQQAIGSKEECIASDTGTYSRRIAMDS